MTEDELAYHAAQLVARVHEDDPADNARWLLTTTTETDRWALLFVLAAMVPDDQCVSERLAWTYMRGPDTPERQALRRAALDDALARKRSAA